LSHVPITNDKPAPVGDGTKPLPREQRRQVIVEVLAIAVIDFLVAERERVQGEHEAATR
jgi:hypothetical protein